MPNSILFNSDILDIGTRFNIHQSYKNFGGKNVILLVKADRLKKRYKNIVL
jgi:hypothetical protein